MNPNWRIELIKNPTNQIVLTTTLINEKYSLITIRNSKEKQYKNKIKILYDM